MSAPTFTTDEAVRRVACGEAQDGCPVCEAAAEAIRGERPFISRDGRFWEVVFPAAPGEGFDLCTGPHWTRWGARLSLRFWNWSEGR